MGYFSMAELEHRRFYDFKPSKRGPRKAVSLNPLFALFEGLINANNCKNQSFQRHSKE